MVVGISTIVIILGPPADVAGPTKQHELCLVLSCLVFSPPGVCVTVGHDPWRNLTGNQTQNNSKSTCNLSGHRVCKLPRATASSPEESASSFGPWQIVRSIYREVSTTTC